MGGRGSVSMPMVAALLACAMGAVLGLRFKFTVLFPATVVVVLAALIAGIDAPTGRTVLAIVLSVLTLQLGFLAGAAAHCWLLRYYRRDPVRTDETTRESAHPARGPVA
jgi:hypothetical protein